MDSAKLSIWFGQAARRPVGNSKNKKAGPHAGSGFLLSEAKC